MSLEMEMSALSSAAVFAGLNEEQLRLLAFSSERRRYGAGDFVFKAGELPEGAYVLIEGEVEIVHPGEQMDPVRTSEKGAMLGELALLISKPRPTSAVVIHDATFVYVPRKDFLRLVEAYPRIASALSVRLKDSILRYLGSLSDVRAKLAE
jgi:CRP-like cAMP-binding protein